MTCSGGEFSRTMMKNTASSVTRKGGIFLLAKTESVIFVALRN